MVNICVISTLDVAGVTTTKAATIDASDEFCVVIIAVLFGSYSFISKVTHSKMGVCLASRKRHWPTT
ncbi:hypothetical protein DPMN_115511 [Dreissena polymorpha]|uniref:Uncharacterized protein n=1 Tax=Dreissena polymorpha TaxID=45954 RepID=A0A9D4QSZ7_DREPO|nr:hypothetical protein DPMN_115511 [Dreissena polymorpha]